MTVKDLIKELKKYPKNANIDLSIMYYGKHITSEHNLYSCCLNNIEYKKADVALDGEILDSETVELQYIYKIKGDKKDDK
jgi:hypothetical protein